MKIKSKEETEIQSKILRYLLKRKAYCVKVVVATRAGVPDIICCYNGKFIAFEVKSGKNIAGNLQQHNIEMIRESGGMAFVVRSVDEVEEALQGIFENELMEKK